MCPKDTFLWGRIKFHVPLFAVGLMIYCSWQIGIFLLCKGNTSEIRGPQGKSPGGLFSCLTEKNPAGVRRQMKAEAE